MKLAIVGAGGHGRVVLDILRAAGGHEVVAFIDSNPQLTGRRVDGVRVAGTWDALGGLAAEGVRGVVVAIGDNGVRRGFAEEVSRTGFELVSAVHPSAQIASNTKLGNNVVVAAGAVVSAHCQIGDSVILNTGCIVDHESMIGTAAHICPGVRLAGHVTVESGAFVGIGATIVQNVRIGFDAVVGAGAVVIRDVHPMTTVVGVPAAEIKQAPSTAEFAELMRGGYHADASDPRNPMRRADVRAGSEPAYAGR